MFGNRVKIHRWVHNPRYWSAITSSSVVGDVRQHGLRFVKVLPFHAWVLCHPILFTAWLHLIEPHFNVSFYTASKVVSLLPLVLLSSFLLVEMSGVVNSTVSFSFQVLRYLWLLYWVLLVSHYLFPFCVNSKWKSV